MAFKLGSSRGIEINGGEVNSKLSFKKEDNVIPGTPVLRKSLGEGILGEANNDGTIFISNKVEPGSDQETQVLIHEMVHMKDMKLGKLAYNDDYIMWDGNTYERKDGKIDYNGKKLPEGDKSFPWEQMPWE
tara:strand:+ start:255 stop:647 length:393 start_codon:yes stop_codon:yes gene_type:complete